MFVDCCQDYTKLLYKALRLMFSIEYGLSNYKSLLKVTFAEDSASA